jgi:hypothetical protein
VAQHIPNDWFRDNDDLWADWARKFTFGYNWVNYESAFDTTALRQAGFVCETDHDTSIRRHTDWLDANNLMQSSTDEDEEDRILQQFS